MKKLILLTLIAFLLNGCRYVNTTEQYINAKESNELTIPEGIDKPNSSSTLEVPSVQKQIVIAENTNPAPPDMPIRAKQSENGELKIAKEDGFPVLTSKTNLDEMWLAMNSISLEDWSIADADKSSCIVTLEYDDGAARDRKNDGFFKKIFRRDKSYSDYSGNYQLSCIQSGNINKVKFSRSDGTKAKTFLADNIMSKLYKKFE